MSVRRYTLRDIKWDFSLLHYVTVVIMVTLVSEPRNEFENISQLTTLITAIKVERGS